MMTPKEVADHYGMHPETIRRDLRDGLLEGHKAPNGKTWEVSDLPEVRTHRRMTPKTCEVCHILIESGRKVLTTIEDRENGGGAHIIDRHRFCSMLCIKTYIDLAIIGDATPEPEPETGFINAMRRVFSGRTS